MSQLTFALLNYHEVHGAFPPAYVADADGTPMHSWRVLVLPFLDGNDIYTQYRFDEPWNGPNNRDLARRRSNALWHCPNTSHQDDSPLTDYVLITGPGTAFPSPATTTLADFLDGPANSILLVEIANSEIHWMEPRDLEVDRMSFRVNDRTQPSISGLHPAGPAVVFADAITAYRLEASVRPTTVRALTTIAGGESVSRKGLIRSGGPDPYRLGE
jgi:hypothetical protein